MSFVFVENATVRDEKSRKLIRSHCMKGKNAGKTRLAREPPEAIKIRSKDAARSVRKDADFNEEAIVAINSVFDDRFAMFSLPSRLDAKMHDQLYRFLTYTNSTIYPREYCHPKSKYNSILFSYLVEDEAAFHCFLTMAAGMDSMLGVRQNDSKEVLKHLGNTYRCINRNLERDETPSDSTVAAVMSMAIYEDLLGQQKRAGVHMDALARIVSLRGGLDKFGGNKMLLQKICRADLGHTLQLGSGPHFYHDLFPREVVESTVERHCLGEHISRVVDGVGITNNELRSIFRDMVSVSCILECRLEKLDAFAFQEILISVLYRLLHLHPLSKPFRGTRFDSLCCLGLLAFMSSTIFQPGRKERLPYEFLAEKLCQALTETSASGLIEERMLFWIFYTGGISVFRQNHMTWLIPWIKATSLSLGIRDWPGARKKLCRYPWISAFHDEPAQELWDEMEKA